MKVAYINPPLFLQDKAIRRKVKTILLAILRDHNLKGESLEFVYMSDEELLEMNKEYLQHDYYTDIITFDISEEPDFICGTLAMSTDRITENASLHKTTVPRETLRVMFHGVLHLAGYKDKTAADQKAMRAAEDKYLTLWDH